jgi:large subunit ribosomal protein L18
VTATLLKRRNGGGVAYKRAVGRARRHFRVRKNVRGSAERPRLVVTRSLRNITAQIVDDLKGHTLASASTLDTTIRGTDGDKKALAGKVGTLLAERAKAAGVGKVDFDRGGNRYAGRIAALADAAREAGLEF